MRPKISFFFCHFLKFRSLFFYYTVYDDSLEQCLTTSRGTPPSIKKGDPNLDHMDQNQTQNQVFCHFFKFGSFIFLEIAQEHSLEHCLTTSREKTHGKNLGVQIGSKIRVFAIFSRLHKQFSLILQKLQFGTMSNIQWPKIGPK